MYEYIPIGVCSKKIIVDVDDNNIITHCEIIGGCEGNRTALAKVIIGRDANEIINLFQNIKCGKKITSCPDQLAIALTDCIELRDIDNLKT